MKKPLLLLSFICTIAGNAQIVTTIAGNGIGGYSGDGGQAILAQINNPSGITYDAAGNIYIGDSGNNRIRKVSTSGIITTVAGNGTLASNGNGGLATAASISNPLDRKST